jgi:hypothetical protein
MFLAIVPAVPRAGKTAAANVTAAHEFMAKTTKKKLKEGAGSPH